MAQTRGATGNARPRIFDAISTEPVTKRKSTTTKRTTAKTAAPKRTTATGRVTKKRAPNTHHKRSVSLKDKISGEAEKIVGKVENKPGKVGAGTKKKRGTDGRGSRTAKKA